MNKDRLIEIFYLIIITLIVIILLGFLIFVLSQKPQNKNVAQRATYTIEDHQDTTTKVADEAIKTPGTLKNTKTETTQEQIERQEESESQEFHDAQEENTKLTLETLNNFLKSEMEVKITGIFFDDEKKAWNFEIEDKKNHINEIVTKECGYWWSLVGYKDEKRNTDIKKDLLKFDENIDNSKKETIVKTMTSILKNKSLSENEMNEFCNILNVSIPEKITPQKKIIIENSNLYGSLPGINSVD